MKLLSVGIFFRGSFVKRFYFCLFFSVVFLVAGCGSSKMEEKTGTGDDSGNSANDSDISADYNPTTDNDVSADSDFTAWEDFDADETATDFDLTDDEDIATEDDMPTDSDQINDSEAADEDYPGCDIEHGVKFIKQPLKMNIAPKNRTVSLVCEAKAQGCGITYQWYESKNSSTDSGTAMPDATNQIFETPVFTEKGIHYYYCAVTAAAPTGESKTYFSNVASVAYTALPTLYINTPDGVEITSKEEWIKNSHISIVGANNESWNFEDVKTSIKGRGNSTWKKPKKPYALKLKEAREILGLPAHKRWVLLANYMDGSFMRNVVAFYFSEFFELGWTVHGEFVDIVLNGSYQGLYWLGEAIKVDKNRVDIYDGNPEMTDDEDKDYLIEMDMFFDENLKFKSEIRDLPYMIQNDSYMVDENDAITGGGEARLERLQAGINALEKLLYPDFTDGMDTNDCSAPDESYSEIIDIDSWIKFWFVNEIMDNWDSAYPRSDFFTFDSANNIFKAGPVWDFDLAASNRAASCQLNKAIYYNALFKSPEFVKRTKELWNEYFNRINIEPVIAATQNRIALAVQYDGMLWVGHHDYINTLPNTQDLTKFEDYAAYLKESVYKKILIVNSFIGNLSATKTNH